MRVIRLFQAASSRPSAVTPGAQGACNAAILVAESSPLPWSDEPNVSWPNSAGGIRNPVPQCVALANQRLRPLGRSEYRLRKWQTLLETTDMSKNCKKAWSLIRKISNDPSTPTRQQYTTTANQVAYQLLLNGKSTTKQPRPKVDRLQHSQNTGLTEPFSLEGLNISIKALKTGKAIGLDNIFTEEIKHFGPLTQKWVLEMMNNYMLTRNIPKIWRKTRIIALLKPGKDPAHAKSYRPISLLCHPYKLFEQLILNRLAPVVEPAIIPQQAGFQPGKSTTSQLLNLTQHIEDGFQKGLVTGAIFVDLSAAYDTVNHRLLLKKILENAKDIEAFTDLIGALLKDRRFYVVLNNKHSRWRRQWSGLPQVSMLAPLLYNIYINDQPMDQNTERFIYADDLCVTSQESMFEAVEENLTSALDELHLYYKRNHLHANPTNTQACSFHLRNQEANRPLNITWSGTPLEHCTNPVYLGVTLDCTLSYKEHVKNTKLKVNSRNNILRKLTNFKWGATAHTLRSTALALVIVCIFCCFVFVLATFWRFSCYPSSLVIVFMWYEIKHSPKVLSAPFGYFQVCTVSSWIHFSFATFPLLSFA